MRKKKDAEAGEIGDTKLPRRIAVELSQAEQSVVTALAVAGTAPPRIAEVVVQASSSLARDTGDDEALADVIRSVRRELER